MDQLRRRREKAHDLKHTASSVKHGGGSVMALTHVAAGGIGSQGFIDAVTANGSSRMNCRCSNQTKAKCKSNPRVQSPDFNSVEQLFS